MDSDNDRKQRRCPKLGDLIEFSYCRACESDGQPCHKVLDCWWEYFDVVGYFRSHLSAEAFQRLTESRPPQKVASLLELIDQARRRRES